MCSIISTYFIGFTLNRNIFFRATRDLKCHFYRLFSLNICSTFLINLTLIFHANNVLNQPNSFYWVYMKQLKHFLSVSYEFWSVYGILRLYFIRLLDAMTQNAIHCHHILFFFHRSIDRVCSPFSLNRKMHCFENTQQHLVDLFLVRC